MNGIYIGFGAMWLYYMYDTHQKFKEARLRHLLLDNKIDTGYHSWYKPRVDVVDIKGNHLNDIITLTT